MKVLICYKATSRYANKRIGKFIFSSEHKCHVFQGKAMSVDQFNLIGDQVLTVDHVQHYGFVPQVKIIKESKVEAPKPAPTPIPAPVEKKSIIDTVAGAISKKKVVKKTAKKGK